MNYDYAISVSCGNDSVAMTQYMVETIPDLNAIAIYCNTGWASEEWPDRVEKFMNYCKMNKIDFIEIMSSKGGMEQMVVKKQMFPVAGSKWCTQQLKIIPFNHAMEIIDPNCETTICVGIRRAESATRRTFPEFSTDENGREKWAPIVCLNESERNELIERAGFDVLKSRSKECSPCIHANRTDLLTTSEYSIKRLEKLELSFGAYFFNPIDRMGAEGIREVIKWANSKWGKYKKPSCDSGFCGS